MYPQLFAHMVTDKGDFKITSFKGKTVGVINIEIVPCDQKGTVIPDQTSFVRNSEVLLNKQINFLFKINTITGIEKNFEV